MEKQKIMSKKIIVIGCMLLMGVILAIMGFIWGNSKADFEEKNVVYNVYEDNEYNDNENTIAYTDESSIEKSIYEQYAADEQLFIQESNGTLSFNVNANIKDKVKVVKSVLAISNEEKTNVVNDDLHFLYLGNKADCEYDSKTGKVQSTPDFEWLVLNNSQPLAMYPYKDSKNKMLTPMYFFDTNKIEYIVIDKSKDKNNVEGILKDGQITPVKEGTKLVPVYASYDAEVINIEENGADPSETLNNKEYVYGTDFKVEYKVLPKDTYQYSMNIIYAENDGKNYGYYTESKDVVANKDKEDTEIVTGSGDDSEYKCVRGISYIKEMMKHNTKVAFSDIYQVMVRGSGDNKKGYIASRNYRTINVALRNDTTETLDEDDKKTIEALDRITTKNTLSNNTLLIRNLNYDYLTSVFGIKSKDGQDLTNELFSTMTKEDKLAVLEEFKKSIGKTIVEKSFLSTSLIAESNVMNDKPVRLVIKASKGTKGYVSLNIGESEFVMPRNTTLLIESIEYDEVNDKYIVETIVKQENPYR